MSLRFTNGMKKVCAMVLVGTIAGGASFGQITYAKIGQINGSSYSALLRGEYSNEEAKKNRDSILNAMESDGNTKVKTLVNNSKKRRTY